MSAKVAEAINAVMGKVGYIQKKGTNSFHNYKFAAIGDVLAELQPAMHDAGLIVIQDEVGNELLEGGSIMTARYAFSLSHKSGEVWPTVAHHTGMAAAKSKNGSPDDKALNKCHTAARKYFLMALFQIPTGDHADPDADGDVPTKQTNGAPPKSSAQAKRAGDFEKLCAEIDSCEDVTALGIWWKNNQARIKALPDRKDGMGSWVDLVTEHKDKRKAEIETEQKLRDASRRHGLPMDVEHPRTTLEAF